MKKLNRKLLLYTFLAGTFLAGGVLAVHAFQTRRIAEALLWQAQRAEKQEQFDQAARLLSRYLELRPEDAQERAHLGQLLASERLAVSPRARQRALFVLEQALNRLPDRHDLRRSVVQLALALGRYNRAQEHLELLQTAFPDEGETKLLLGRAAEAQGRYAEAKDCYEKAIQVSPQQIESYQRLVQLLRRQPDLAPARTADQILDRLVAQNPESVPARLIRLRYLLDQGDFQGADPLEKMEQDVQRALGLAPNEADVVLVAAEYAQARGRLDRARELLQHGLEVEPRSSRLYEALARLEVREGRLREGVACLQRGLQALTGPGQNALRWTLANLLLDDGQAAEAGTEITQLAQGKFSLAGLDYLQARVLLLEGKWSAAARLFERSRAGAEATPGPGRETVLFLEHVDLFLGQCYEQLNDLNRQLAAYTRAVDRDPSSVRARLKLGAVLWTLGRTDEAISQYKQLTLLAQAPPAARMELARLLFLRNLQREPRTWAEVHEALDQAEKAQPGVAEVVLLRAEVLAAQDRLAEAQALLAKARDQQPQQALFWTALASLAERRGQPEEARRILDEAGQRAGDHVDLRLAQARLGAKRRGPSAVVPLVPLAHGLEKFPLQDQTRLLSGLAQIAQQLGDVPQAQQLWQRLAEQPGHQNDLRLKLVLADLALQAQDDGAVQRLLADIRRLDGEQSVFGRYGEARRLLCWAKPGDSQALDQAARLLDAVAAERPGWPAVQLARAEVEELRGRHEQAIARYREVLQQGERSPRVLRRLVQLLHQRRQYREADEEIRRWQRDAPLPTGLQRLAVDLCLRTQDFAGAVRLATSLVANDSQDYRDYLWLGQVLAASGQRPEAAEQNLRRAVALGGNEPEPWVSLVEFLASRGQHESAQAELERARAHLAKDQAALAQCYEALGRLDQAQEQFQAALALKPEDPALLRQVANFSLRSGHLAGAAPHLRRIVALGSQVAPADLAWARRNLAWVLAQTGSASQLAEALGLVGLSLTSGDEVVVVDSTRQGEDLIEEQRARARVLATQARRSLRGHALVLLEDLSKRQALTPDDQFRLAQLQEVEGNWPKAREEYRNLLVGQPHNALYPARFAQSLIRRGELEEAQRCLDRLERLEKTRRLEPGDSESVMLRAQLLEARGQGNQAIALLQEHVKRKDARPDDFLLLAGCLARQGRKEEALDLCEQAQPRCAPERVGATQLAVLRVGKPDDQHCGRVEKALQAAVEKHPQSAALRLYLADLRDLQKRFAEAEALYRQVLERDRQNLIALNNLAWLLTQRPDAHAEARALIDRALAVYGPRAELLDTRAKVYLALGQTAFAVKDLEQATAENPTAPRYFQLALAHWKASNREAARKVYTQAKRWGFHPDQLHPLDREMARRIAEELQLQ